MLLDWKVKTMRKRIWLLVIIAIIAAVLVYKNPVEIQRKFYGSTISSIGSNNKAITIRIGGYLHRNLFSQDRFSGSAIIDGKFINISTSIPDNLKMRIGGMRDKLKGKPILAVATHLEEGYVETIGQVIISRDFKMLWGYSDDMREQYNDKDIAFAGALDGKQPAAEVMKILDSKQY